MKSLTKTIFISLFLIMAVSILSYAIQNVTIETGNFTEFSNRTNISIPVSLNNNESVVGFEFSLNHTNYLIFKGINATSRMPNAIIEAFDENGFLKMAALIENGISAGNEPIMSLIFDVNSSAIAGDYPLNITNAITVDIGTQQYLTSPMQGIFTILIDSDNDGIDNSNDFCPETFGCLNYSGCSFGLNEWLPPINNLTEFDLQQGATLPLKFSATNCSGAFYEDNDILVKVINTTLAINRDYNASGTGNDYINITNHHYSTNIDTNALSMPLGTYDIYAMFSNNLTSIFGFELVQQGPANGKGKGLGPKF